MRKVFLTIRAGATADQAEVVAVTDNASVVEAVLRALACELGLDLNGDEPAEPEAEREVCRA